MPAATSSTRSMGAETSGLAAPSEAATVVGTSPPPCCAGGTGSPLTMTTGVAPTLLATDDPATLYPGGAGGSDPSLNSTSAGFNMAAIWKRALLVEIFLSGISARLVSEPPPVSSLVGAG